MAPAAVLRPSVLDLADRVHRKGTRAVEPELVSGPLEVGNSTAIASITQSVGKAPKIDAKTFGRFSVNGQEFGFDQNGFRYAGQGQDSKAAIKQANDALKNAGIQIDLAPVLTNKDETGKTTYTIGGLLITTTQTSPSPPAIRKLARQPTASASAGISSGVRIAPKLGAVLAMPSARERSRAGK